MRECERDSSFLISSRISFPYLVFLFITWIYITIGVNPFHLQIPEWFRGDYCFSEVWFSICFPLGIVNVACFAGFLIPINLLENCLKHLQTWLHWRSCKPLMFICTCHSKIVILYDYHVIICQLWLFCFLNSRISDNNFTGTIPEFIFRNWTKLEQMWELNFSYKFESVIRNIVVYQSFKLIQLW